VDCGKNGLDRLRLPSKESPLPLPLRLEDRRLLLTLRGEDLRLLDASAWRIAALLAVRRICFSIVSLIEGGGSTDFSSTR
jgi:hypothetical protein